MDTNLLYKNKFINTNIEANNDIDDTDDEADEVKDVIQETHLLIVDSKDRDWSGESSDPLTFDYTVKFAPSSDLGDAKGQARLAHFLKNFKNIVSIEFTDIILPDIYLDLKNLHSLTDTNHNIITSSTNVNIDSRNIRFPRLSDLPYISLKINEIGSNIDGTNSEINTSTAILVPNNIRQLSNNNSGNYSDNNVITYEYNNLGKNIVANSHNNSLIFKSITPWKKVYYPNPKNSINLINVSFFEPSGNPIKLLNDLLEVESVGIDTLNGCGEVLELVSNRYNTNLSNWTPNHPLKRLDPSATPVSTLAISSTGTGTGAQFNISTNIDGRQITLSKIGNNNNFGGIGYANDDYLIIEDIDSGTNNICNFVIKSVNSEGTILDLTSSSHDISIDASDGLRFKGGQIDGTGTIYSLTGSGIGGTLIYKTNSDGNIITLKTTDSQFSNGIGTIGYNPNDIIYIIDSSSSTNNRAYFIVSSVSSGKITGLENKTYLVNGKFQGGQSNISISTKTTNTNPNKREYYTSGTGNGAEFRISTNIEGSRVSITLVSGGLGYKVNDTIVIKDAGITDNLSKFIISSVNVLGEIESFKNTTYQITNKFEGSQTLKEVTDIDAPDEGSGVILKISTNEDGSVVTVHLISGGINYSVNDRIVIIDPGITNNRAYFTIRTTGSNGNITNFVSNTFNVEKFLFQPNQTNISLSHNNITNISSNSNSPLITKPNIILSSNSEGNLITLNITNGGRNYNKGDILSILDPYNGTGNKAYFRIKSTSVVDPIGQIISFYDNSTSEVLDGSTELKKPVYNVNDGNLIGNQTNVTINTITHIREGITPITGKITTNSNQFSNQATLTIDTKGKNYKIGDIIEVLDPGLGSLSNKAFFQVKTVTGNVITINTNNYFSPEEYKVGDKIIFKDMQFSKTSFYDKNYLDSKELEVFLTRLDGHIILNLSEANNNVTTSRCNMFNQIQISLPYSLSSTTGNSSLLTDYKLGQNIEGLVGSINTTNSVTLSNTSDLNYSTIIDKTTDFFNNKKIIFTSGIAKDSIRTITDYSIDSNNNLIATLDSNIALPSQGDKYRIVMASDCSGKLINLYLQNIIAFKLVTEKKDEAIFKDNIII